MITNVEPECTIDGRRWAFDLLPSIAYVRNGPCCSDHLILAWLFFRVIVSFKR